MLRIITQHDCCLAGNASHLIPVELALKVAAKIDAGEHFGCIILLPMYSEGLFSWNILPHVLCDLQL